MPGETIAQAVNGRYENGFAMLVVTDHRVLLIDKKPMFLTLEDIRFDMIAEIDFSAQLFDCTVKIMTTNRTLVFISWNHGRLRKALNYTQQRVSEMRHHYLGQQFQAQRNPVHSAPLVGGLALQGGNQTDQTMVPAPFHPYNKVSLRMRKHHVPKFY